MLLVLGLLACAARREPAALGWSLGGEAHVFYPGDRFARDYYRSVTGSSHLSDTLTRRPLVAIQPRHQRSAKVFSANGAAPATVTLARFHAPGACGYDGVITELVLAFRPTANQGTPPPHKPVVAIFDGGMSIGAGGTVLPALTRHDALDLLNRVVARVESGAPLLRPLVVDADQAADAGEVVALASGYGVGFRARVLKNGADTVLVTGVAATDRELRRLRWVIRPRQVRLTAGMIPRTATAVRYSLRGGVAVNGGLILVDEIADVSARESRATVIDLDTRRVIATQPLALHCP
ncbi:MAG: hypothetical protein ABR537_02280 [Gemmatimonadales bacterium]